jgi:AcrR family transcriptional regulator
VPTTKADLVTEFRRGQILEAARGRFLAAGLKGTTVSQIAQAAGVAKGTVYLYFESKDAVLHQILSDDLDRLREETLPAIEADAPLEVRLRRYFTAMVAFYEERKDFIELCQIELGRELRQSARGLLGDVFTAQQAAWTATLPGGEGTESVRNGRLIVSLGYGLAIQRIRGWLGGAVEEEIEAAVRLVARGAAAS